jgi:DNA-binding response OmpR family regulator
LVDVAVINTSEELAELLESVLASEGWSTARGYTLDFKRNRQDITAFLEEYDPSVILWDVAIPYEDNWAYLQEVQRLSAAQGRRFVLTTTNAEVLQRLVGHEVPALEIVGKPFDLDQICTAVEQALSSTRGSGG